MKADEFVVDNQKIEIAGMKITVIETPGHTLGGVCYYIEKEHVLFAGDTLFFESYGRTDFSWRKYVFTDSFSWEKAICTAR